MYTVYEIPGVKVGVTTNFAKRQKRQKDLGEMIVLEDHIDIYKASERERELQADKGYKVDKNPYWYVRQIQQERAKAPEAKKKRATNTDYKARVASIDHKEVMSHLQRGVIAISPEGIETTYSGANEAARQLTKKTGIKFYQGGISMVCNPNYIDKLHRGYTFKYV